MGIKQIESHKLIRLIEFALENNSFTIEQALNASGMSEYEFSGAKQTLFELRGEHEYAKPQQLLEWRLSPSAFFSYLSFLQYKHALKTSTWALRIAVISTGLAFLSVLIALIALLQNCG